MADDLFDFYGGVDADTFHLHGHGGWGYDTSHIVDEMDSSLVRAAGSGDMTEVKRLVEEAYKKAAAIKAKALLETRQKSGPAHNIAAGGASGTVGAAASISISSSVPSSCSSSDGCAGGSAPAQGASSSKADGTTCSEIAHVSSSSRADQHPDEVIPKNVRILLNWARKWTDVSPRMSGFLHESPWYDLTALATAARAGRARVVKYLLEQGADPSLAGAPEFNLECYQEQFNAWTAPDNGRKHKAWFNKNGKKDDDFDVCDDLLEAAYPFWKKASYCSQRPNTERDESGFPNLPTDLEALRKALAAVPGLDGKTGAAASTATGLNKDKEVRERSRNRSGELRTSH